MSARASMLRSARGQRRTQGRTRPASDQPVTRWDNRPPEPEPTVEGLLSRWRRHRPEKVKIADGVRAGRKARRLAERRAAKARARANGKRS